MLPNLPGPWRWYTGSRRATNPRPRSPPPERAKLSTLQGLQRRRGRNPRWISRSWRLKGASSSRQTQLSQARDRRFENRCETLHPGSGMVGTRLRGWAPLSHPEPRNGPSESAPGRRCSPRPRKRVATPQWAGLTKTTLPKSQHERPKRSAGRERRARQLESSELATDIQAGVWED